MNIFLVEFSKCIRCFNKYDQNKIIKHYIFNWLMINVLLCFILSRTIMHFYLMFENKYYIYNIYPYAVDFLILRKHKVALTTLPYDFLLLSS